MNLTPTTRLIPMKGFFASSVLTCLVLTGCGGGADLYFHEEPSYIAHPTYEYLTHPTISGLEYFNTETGSLSSLTTAGGRYTGYTGFDTVSFVLGDILLFTMPGELSQPYGSLYDASRHPSSSLYSATAVENLMAFLMTVDDDGNYMTGIQIAHPVRVAARGLRVNFNQSAYSFRSDPTVQYATAVLSGNTLYGPRPLPSVAAVQLAIRVP